MTGPRSRSPATSRNCASPARLRPRGVTLATPDSARFPGQTVTELASGPLVQSRRKGGGGAKPDKTGFFSF